MQTATANAGSRGAQSQARDKLPSLNTLPLQSQGYILVSLG